MRIRQGWSSLTSRIQRLAALGTVATVVGLLVAALTVAGGASSAAASSKPDTSGTTFSTTFNSGVSTFNPFLAYYTGETEDVLQNIYPTLTWLNQQNQPVPYLATSWNVSSNKLVWTFHIKPGLKWSDGQPLTAADAAWTYNLMMHNSTAATANGQLVANFKTVTAPNATTLVITTKIPLANMTSLVDTPPIVPEHIWKNHIKGLANFTNTTTPVVGYGPYELTQYAPSQYAVLSANKSFFLGPSKYNKVILYYYANTQGAVAAMRSGQLDATDDLTAAEWKALQGQSGIKTYQQVSNAWEAVELNPGARTRGKGGQCSGGAQCTVGQGGAKWIGNGNPALRNPAVRRAIATAINRNELVTKVLDGYGVPGSAYLPPAFPTWKYTPSAADAANFSLTKAGQELTAAGYPKGKNGMRYSKATGKPLVLRLGIHSDYPSDAQLGQYLSGWLQSIGVKVNVQAMSNTQLNDDLAVGNWDMLLDQWSTSYDPTALFSIQTCGVLPTNASGSGGNTDSFFCAKKFDQLFNQQQGEFNLSTRASQIREMQNILYNANNDVILFYPNTLSAVKTGYTKGYLYGEPDANGFYPLQNEQMGWLKAIPSASASSSSGGGSTGIIIAIVVVVLAGGGFLLLRSRKRLQTADETE